MERENHSVGQKTPHWRRAWIAAALLCLAMPTGCSKHEATLPKLGSVAAFSFTDQNGRAFSSRSLVGAPWVGAFFFTRCPTVCPKITARVKSLQELGTREKLPFKLVSISIDPDNDTPEVLLAYAQRYGLDLARVTLLRGPGDEVQRLSEGTFKLAMSGRPDPNADHLGMMHSGHLVLVDAEGVLRGYYRSSDDVEMRRLEVDLRNLSRP
ncbi:MAG: SCO family protein [Polyangiaceae bacterium]